MECLHDEGAGDEGDDENEADDDEDTDVDAECLRHQVQGELGDGSLARLMEHLTVLSERLVLTIEKADEMPSEPEQVAGEEPTAATLGVGRALFEALVDDAGDDVEFDDVGPLVAAKACL